MFELLHFYEENPHKYQKAINLCKETALAFREVKAIDGEALLIHAMAQLEDKLLAEITENIKEYGGVETVTFKQTVKFINDRIEQLSEDSENVKNQIIVGWIC